MRATRRRATCVASLILAVSGISPVWAQGTAVPGARPTFPAGAAPARPAGAAPAAPASAAPAARPAGGPSVVVIDVGEVFKKHVAFNQQVEAVKKEMKDLEASFQTEQKKAVDARAKLSQYAPGSPEYKKLEEDVARMASDLQVAMALKQKSILEQEAKIYYSTYQEIYKQVEEFSDRYGITLVLRHSNLPMDPQKRETVFRGMERQIVFQRNLDITEEIISRVNRGAVLSAQQPRGPAAGGANGSTAGARPSSTGVRPASANR